MKELAHDLYMSKKIDTANILSIEDAKHFLNKRKCIIVTGVTGQDGSFMVDYLLKNTTDYIIFGGVRRLSVYNHTNIKHIEDNRFKLINFDLTDAHSISQIIEKLQPDYFINFAAQSFVASSWDFARQTWATNSTSVLDLLEAIRLYKPTCRLYQAGSSEEFGDVAYTPQDESHPLRPRSPYGASKAASRQLIKVYRESYGLYAIQGWLFNHESERRGVEFVTRKITTSIAKIKKDLIANVKITPLELGNIDAKRDWSHAEDFMHGVWLMLNQDAPKEYVLASGETHTVREFVEKAFGAAGIHGHWSYSTNINISLPLEQTEVFVESSTNQVLMKINPKFYRPAEVELLLGDPSKAKKELGWEPRIHFNNLINRMVSCDLEAQKLNEI